jgi:hypothetical protein
MEEFAHNFHLDKLYGGHPPWRYRLRVVLKDLTDPDVDLLLSQVQDDLVITKVKERVQALRKLVENDHDRSVIENQPFSRIGFRFVEKAIPKAEAIVAKYLGKHNLFDGESLKRLSSQVGKLVQRLHCRIPPNEFQGADNDFYPANLPGILNAGWFYRIGYQDSFFNQKTPTGAPATDPVAVFIQADDAVNRVVLRAIEYADLQKEWGEWKAEKEKKG